MPNQQIKVELIGENKNIPIRKREGDAAFDVFAPMDFSLLPGRHITVSLGFKIELPSDYCALITERSGHAKNYGISTIGNLIDPNYRGEIHAILINNGIDVVTIEKGDRMCQLLILPFFTGSLVIGNVDQTERGEAGLGSSGVK